MSDRRYRLGRYLRNCSFRNGPYLRTGLGLRSSRQCHGYRLASDALGMRRPLDAAFFCSERDKNLSRGVVRTHKLPKGDWPSACAFEWKGKILTDTEVSTKRPKMRTFVDRASETHFANRDLTSLDLSRTVWVF